MEVAVRVRLEMCIRDSWYYALIYLLWFLALWFHLTHGVWSMFQSAGWAGDTWYPRLKWIARIVATIVFLGFACVVVIFYLRANEMCIRDSPKPQGEKRRQPEPATGKFGRRNKLRKRGRTRRWSNPRTTAEPIGRPDKCPGAGRK